MLRKQSTTAETPSDNTSAAMDEIILSVGREAPREARDVKGAGDGPIPKGHLSFYSRQFKHCSEQRARCTREVQKGRTRASHYSGMYAWTWMHESYASLLVSNQRFYFALCNTSGTRQTDTQAAGSAQEPSLRYPA